MAAATCSSCFAASKASPCIAASRCLQSLGAATSKASFATSMASPCIAVARRRHSAGATACGACSAHFCTLLAAIRDGDGGALHGPPAAACGCCLVKDILRNLHSVSFHCHSPLAAGCWRCRLQRIGYHENHTWCFGRQGMHPLQPQTPQKRAKLLHLQPIGCQITKRWHLGQ